MSTGTITSIKVVCPSCQKPGTITTATPIKAGTRLKCIGCGHIFQYQEEYELDDCALPPRSDPTVATQPPLSRKPDPEPWYYRWLERWAKGWMICALIGGATAMLWFHYNLITLHLASTAYLDEKAKTGVYSLSALRDKNPLSQSLYKGLIAWNSAMLSAGLTCMLLSLMIGASCLILVDIGRNQRKRAK
jgi:hypothetical protein